MSNCNCCCEIVKLTHSPRKNGRMGALQCKWFCVFNTVHGKLPTGKLPHRRLPCYTNPYPNPNPNPGGICWGEVFKERGGGGNFTGQFSSHDLTQYFSNKINAETHIVLWNKQVPLKEPGYNGFPQINIPFSFSRINKRLLVIMDGCNKCYQINSVISLQVFP